MSLRQRFTDGLRALADLIDGVALWNETVDRCEREEMEVEVEGWDGPLRAPCIGVGGTGCPCGPCIVSAFDDLPRQTEPCAFCQQRERVGPFIACFECLDSEIHA